jgi:adenylyltransferase/sulfurtransferase
VVQATETVKLLLGKGEPLIGRLLTYDALGMRFREVRLRRDPKCPLCGEHPTIRDLSIHAETAEACELTPDHSTAAAR